MKEVQKKCFQNFVDISFPLPLPSRKTGYVLYKYWFKPR